MILQCMKVGKAVMLAVSQDGLKADFASGHLSEGILRNRRLGLLPENVSKIEQILVPKLYN